MPNIEDMTPYEVLSVLAGVMEAFEENIRILEAENQKLKDDVARLFDELAVDRELTIKLKQNNIELHGMLECDG